MIALFVGEVLVTAFLFAMVEIHIEGPDGWAAKLPTWRKESKWTKMLLGHKPLTGYHLYMFTFVFVFLHFPYALDLAPLTWKSELRILSFMIFFWVIEDFLWFVLNPHYGLRKFKPQFIWWHAHSWWWIMPRDYVIYGPIGILLYYLSL
ncbi:MAG: hypothetical protein WBD36_04475 [Bacteroidota bacterium]